MTSFQPATLILLLGLVSPLLAEPPTFIARTVTGKEYRGPLVKLDDSWSVEVGKGVRKRVSGDELLSLSQQGVKLPSFPTDEHLLLANGDRVPARDLRLDDEKLHFRHK